MAPHLEAARPGPYADVQRHRRDRPAPTGSCRRRAHRRRPGPPRREREEQKVGRPGSAPIAIAGGHGREAGSGSAAGPAWPRLAPVRRSAREGRAIDPGCEIVCFAPHPGGRPDGGHRAVGRPGLDRHQHDQPAPDEGLHAQGAPRCHRRLPLHPDEPARHDELVHHLEPVLPRVPEDHHAISFLVPPDLAAEAEAANVDKQGLVVLR